MSVQTFVLDAWALLALLQKEEPAATHVKTLIKRSQEGKAGKLFVSMINLGEVYYRVGREWGADAAQETVDSLRYLGLTILPATNERVYAAADYKMRYRMSYADAFAAAATEELDGTLMTGDPELIQLQTEMQIKALSRNKG